MGVGACCVAVAVGMFGGVDVASRAVVCIVVGVGFGEDADPTTSTTQDPSSLALATSVYLTPLMVAFAIEMLRNEEEKRKRPLPDESTLKSDNVPG